MNPTKITIGKAAAAAGVNVETIRFYQRRGLLVEPPKVLGGFRYYDEATVARVRFIKRAQALGFSLKEVLSLLALEQSTACYTRRTMQPCASCNLWRNESTTSTAYV